MESEKEWEPEIVSIDEGGDLESALFSESVEDSQQERKGTSEGIGGKEHF